MAHRRMIEKARMVLVEVTGPNDIFYAKVSKREALRLLARAQGQLEVVAEMDGKAFIGGRI